MASSPLYGVSVRNRGLLGEFLYRHKDRRTIGHSDRKRPNVRSIIHWLDLYIKHTARLDYLHDRIQYISHYRCYLVVYIWMYVSEVYG